MQRHFDVELGALKSELLQMAGAVELGIECAVDVMRALDPESAQAKLKQIYRLEEKVNQAHKNVDDACVRLLALQQPLAADLRLIVAIIKINTDLERMSDQAVNIAHNTERNLSFEPVKSFDDLKLMGDQVRAMVRGALDSFVKRDQVMARNVLIQDDIVDEAKNRVFKEMKEYMKSAEGNVELGLNVILIARNLERIGDHATNIAEDVIFAISGEDIRHTGQHHKGGSQP